MLFSYSRIRKIGVRMQCKRKECIKEWLEFVSDEEENANGYRNGGYTYMHCEMEGCHTLYFKGKNGSTCEWCELEVCESCADDGILSKYDDFYCSKECYEEYKNSKK